jgi:hypothetical protein
LPSSFIIPLDRVFSIPYTLLVKKQVYIKEDLPDMTGSTFLIFKPKFANYIFESGDKRKIIFTGLAEHPSFSRDMEFLVEAIRVGDDFKYRIIKIPEPRSELENEEGTSYGDFKIWDDTDAPRITVRIAFRPQDFDRLVYFTDRCFFSSNSTLNIHFTIANVELGWGPQLDKIPFDEHLKIIGYDFSMRNSESFKR